ncbi:MAG TPA: metallophosphoesterase [Solirubrobacterales bacterium]|nr:metallophosphoesterase [Solirubrobacterales bacterium]
MAACLSAIPATANALKVAAAGDISCPADSTRQNAIPPGAPEPAPGAAKCQGKRVADMIAAQDPDVALAIGDLIQGQPSYTHAYNDFSQAWGGLGTRIAASVGNHDYHQNANGVKVASGYFRYWESQKAPVWSYGKPNKGWSSWDAGKWHMINLNSNCNAADCTFTGPQLRWLVKDLQENRRNSKTQCTMAYFHHPLFSSGVARGRSGDASLVGNLWEVLYRFRTDLVVTGHQHFYERYFPQNPSGERDETGITQIITGTGGASTFRPAGEDDVPAVNSAFSLRSLGATFLDLEDDGYSSYFRDMLGAEHDQTPPTTCLKPGAGHDERVPRVKRYQAHMKRMAALDKRLKKLDRRIKTLRKDGTPSRKVDSVLETRRAVSKTRERVRVSRLY